jgi:hypothetical protein
VPIGGVVFRRHCGEPLGVLGLPDVLEELDGLRRFVSASLRVITLAISLSMVRRECGSRPGIVASEELGTGIVCRDCETRLGNRDCDRSDHFCIAPAIEGLARMPPLSTTM